MASLDFVFTGGSACCVVKRSRSESVISGNYQGECLVFSSEVTVSTRRSSVGMGAPVKLKKLRVTLTPDRGAAYVECGFTELREVYLVSLLGD